MRPIPISRLHVIVALCLAVIFAQTTFFAAQAPPPKKSETGVEVTAPTGPGIPNRDRESLLNTTIGPNIRTNSREDCGGRGVTQSETAVAAFGDDIVVAYNDTRVACDPDRGVIGYAYSRDGGQTFVDGGGLPRGFDSGDPWLAVNSSGTFFLSGIWQRTNALAMVRGAFSETGLTWDEPTVLGGLLYDKPALTIDPSNGTLYMAYTRLFVGIQIRRSTDDGYTWALSTTIPGTIGNQGAFPAVGSSGEIYVALARPAAPRGAIAVSKSINEGRNFSTPIEVGQSCGFIIAGYNRPTVQQQLLTMPALAVDTSGGPFNGNVYVTWASGCGGDADVFLSRSEDGGATWSDPLRVNDDTTNGLQFFPSIAVDAGGNVTLIFYDRRENPGTAVTDVYMARSRDGGLTFENTKVTSVASDWAAARFDATPNFGDYITAISAGSDVLATWADSRDGDPDCYFARITP
ncbi:MAG: exo-alpha-sialidase [Acidobacteria bacterium]|nr:exo-alpha-sialidase [Acidobacteriota bacterium]MBI3655594.1 exo-alpha-sialidase [Acidobacteriota bacterium]